MPPNDLQENILSLFNKTACNETHTVLFQCADLDEIGIYDCGENNIARVICENLSPAVTTASMMTKISVRACMDSYY